MKNRKNALITTLVLVGIVCASLLVLTNQNSAVAGLSVQTNQNDAVFQKEHVSFMPMREILKSPEKALENGIPGYITATNICEKRQILGKSGIVSFTYDLVYTNFNEEKTSCTIRINPKSEDGTYRYQTLGDGKGEICINDCLNYSLEKGEYVLLSGNKMTLEVTVTLPDYLPKTSIPIGLLGITADVPIKIENSGWIIIE